MPEQPCAEREPDAEAEPGDEHVPIIETAFERGIPKMLYLPKDAATTSCFLALCTLIKSTYWKWCNFSSEHGEHGGIVVTSWVDLIMHFKSRDHPIILLVPEDEHEVWNLIVRPQLKALKQMQTDDWNKKVNEKHETLKAAENPDARERIFKEMVKSGFIDVLRLPDDLRKRVRRILCGIIQMRAKILFHRISGRPSDDPHLMALVEHFRSLSTLVAYEVHFQSARSRYKRNLTSCGFAGTGCCDCANWAILGKSVCIVSAVPSDLRPWKPDKDQVGDVRSVNSSLVYTNLIGYCASADEGLQLTKLQEDALKGRNGVL
jgi:hypothetical protein